MFALRLLNSRNWQICLGWCQKNEIMQFVLICQLRMELLSSDRILLHGVPQFFKFKFNLTTMATMVGG